MKKNIVYLIVIGFLAMSFSAGATQYAGVLGDYKSYDAKTTFTVNLSTDMHVTTLQGKVLINNHNRTIFMRLLPVPPSTPMRPGLMVGYLIFPRFLPVYGSIMFFGENMTHMVGSWSLLGRSGWFSADIST